jgi:hypothetical protein
LKPPPGSDPNGAKLTLRLYIPDGHIRALGPITLRADANREPLPARTFSKPGSYEYTAEIPAARLASSPLYVNFHLDKAVTSAATDARELGTVVTYLGLEAKPAGALVTAR